LSYTRLPFDFSGLALPSFSPGTDLASSLRAQNLSGAELRRKLSGAFNAAFCAAPRGLAHTVAWAEEARVLVSVEPASTSRTGLSAGEKGYRLRRSCRRRSELLDLFVGFVGKGSSQERYGEPQHFMRIDGIAILSPLPVDKVAEKRTPGVWVGLVALD
jgi:hypothetical protein